MGVGQGSYTHEDEILSANSGLPLGPGGFGGQPLQIPPELDNFQGQPSNLSQQFKADFNQHENFRGSGLATLQPSMEVG